jgi:hypothetical protein
MRVFKTKWFARWANVSDKALVALKLLGSQLLGYDARTLTQALRAGELHEVKSDE